MENVNQRDQNGMCTGGCTACPDSCCSDSGAAVMQCVICSSGRVFGLCQLCDKYGSASRYRKNIGTKMQFVGNEKKTFTFSRDILPDYVIDFTI
ncbi:MAG: hypothetical protein ACI32N_05130 [Bulleidia sp.]